ncbi:MAG: hypothetical protein AAF317_16165 [Pseudomonadota bacterium]
MARSIMLERDTNTLDWLERQLAELDHWRREVERGRSAASSLAALDAHRAWLARRIDDLAPGRCRAA